MYYSRQQLDCQGEEASTSTAYERLRDLRLRANNKAASLENGKRTGETSVSYPLCTRGNPPPPPPQPLPPSFGTIYDLPTGPFFSTTWQKYTILSMKYSQRTGNTKIDEYSIYPCLKTFLFSILQNRSWIHRRRKRSVERKCIGYIFLSISLSDEISFL